MQEKVSDEDFAHAQRVWEEFECKNMGEFHDLVFENVMCCCLPMS